MGDFRRRLRGLINAAEAEVIFFDLERLWAGERWNDKIIHVLRYAKALVCLTSPSYFTRLRCGRELEVFRRRFKTLHLPVGTDVTFIFPIWWQRPTSPRLSPASLADGEWGPGATNAMVESCQKPP